MFFCDAQSNTLARVKKQERVHGLGFGQLQPRYGNKEKVLKECVSVCVCVYVCMCNIILNSNFTNSKHSFGRDREGERAGGRRGEEEGGGREGLCFDGALYI